MYRTTTTVKNLIFLFLQFLTIAVSYSLEGKVALVTGSSGGIGKGIALELAKHGVRVCVHYNSREEGALDTKRQLGNDKCLGVLQCDFLQLDKIPEFMQKVNELCGGEGIDILVNNAGAINKLALEDDDDEVTIWRETLTVNLHAPCLLSKLALSQMKNKKKGRRGGGGGVILNVSSIHGEKSNEYMGAYAASKSGLDSLTRTMAIEFAPYNIRVNSIAPGVVPVERTLEAFRNLETKQSWEEKIPLNKLGTVDEVAKASISLIENDWVTGSIWSIDGGMMARANFPKRDRPEK